MPGLMEWPGVLSPDEVNHPCFTSDYFPTIAGILGHQMGNYPLDGIDLMPVLMDSIDNPERNLMFSHRGQQAVIGNEFKLYSSDHGDTFELFNMSVDSMENFDVSDKYPEIKFNMIEEWQQWKTSVAQSLNGADYQ